MGAVRLRATQDHLLQLLIIFIIFPYTSEWPYKVAAAAAKPLQELVLGFKVTPDPSVSSFQPILTDPTGNFSLGFLRINRTHLSPAVTHLPSLEPLWQPAPAAITSFRWSDSTQLFFNGSLVVSDPKSGLFWSTGNSDGDKVLLLNSSNLQIQKVGPTPLIVWQSFDHPTNTLVENQNLTSAMSLVSSNGLYSLRLGNDFMALYAKFGGQNDVVGQIYWKHKALEAKVDIVEGKGPILARVSSDGYLGIYQNGSTPPADVQAFNTFQQPISTGFLLVRVELDGNLKGYYWDGEKWVLDYEAIDDICELPSPCGSYGLCKAGSGCSCLDNQTEFQSGGCYSVQSGNLCSEKGGKIGNAFSVLRRKGVELPYKELMGYKTASSLDECESFCDNNCSCWGAVYNNASGFCYLVDYPIQTLLGVGDQTKVGYFKVKKGEEKHKMGVGIRIGVGLLCGAIFVLVGTIGYGGYKIRMRRRGAQGLMEEDDGVSPGPYKDLGSASFRSIEMCSNTR